MAIILLWTLLGFLAGSILFSLWLTLLVSKTDIRLHGDGNPGGMNAIKYGNWGVGFLAGVLDLLKAFLPVHFAQQAGVMGWGLVPVALAPVLGHAFSPLVGFRGGKAIAATLGVWLAITGWAAAIAYAIFALTILTLQMENALAAMAGMLGLSVLLWISHSPDYLLAAWAGNFLLLLWKHRREVRQPVRVRSWAARLFTWRAR